MSRGCKLRVMIVMWVVRIVPRLFSCVHILIVLIIGSPMLQGGKCQIREAKLLAQGDKAQYVLNAK